MSDRPIAASEAGFLSRWSRLKTQPVPADQAQSRVVQASLHSATTAVALEVAPEDAGAAVVGDVAEGNTQDIGEEAFAETAAETADAQSLTDADMPTIESLDEASDFSGFLSEKVSEQLRRKALSKLFHLPEFNVRDGLNDYDEDYSTFVPLGDTVTYQMKQFIERQKQQFNEALEAEDDDQVTARAATGSDTAEPSAEDALSSTEVLCADEADGELGACE